MSSMKEGKRDEEVRSFLNFEGLGNVSGMRRFGRSLGGSLEGS